MIHHPGPVSLVVSIFSLEICLVGIGVSPQTTTETILILSFKNFTSGIFDFSSSIRQAIDESSPKSILIQKLNGPGAIFLAHFIIS